MRSPRFFVITGIVILAVGLSSAGWLWKTQVSDQTVSWGWEDCLAPRIEAVPSWAELGADEWDGPRLALSPVADVPAATGMTQTPSGDLLVSGKDGRLHLVDDGTTEVILDIGDQVSDGVEQGLVDVLYDPVRGQLYLALTDLEGTLEVRAYTTDVRGLPIGDPRLVIAVPQPHEWHNAGDLELGPDGMLYISLGDGGRIGDPGLNGQDRNTLLGTIVRIDPTRDGYDIPPGNPFGGFFTGGAEETVAYGFRNPWRFSFDRATGDLWVADVGQNCVEEVNLIPAGEWGLNFGWSRSEGSYRFQGDLPRDQRLPAFEYLHPDGGCSITGGYVYRGSAIPDLQGMYVFADYCRGRVHALDLDNGEVVGLVDLGVRRRLLASFGEDADGELYVLSLEDGVSRIVVAGG